MRSATCVGAWLESPNSNHLCHLLEQRRKFVGLGQEAVARALGVAQSYVCDYEAARKRLDFFQLQWIAVNDRYDPPFSAVGLRAACAVGGRRPAEAAVRGGTRCVAVRCAAQRGCRRSARVAAGGAPGTPQPQAAASGHRPSLGTTAVVGE
ncbi:MAG: helix-turn-helix domain-containing protein [Actinophytocola sp.]|nr:helix-turn-helix domain-containing protein [Actinophytocola sp.]